LIIVCSPFIPVLDDDDDDDDDEEAEEEEGIEDELEI